jgi:hypothetical protein
MLFWETVKVGIEKVKKEFSKGPCVAVLANVSTSNY